MGMAKSSALKPFPLVHDFVREHSLLYGFVWYESDFRHITELWSQTVERFVLIKEANTNKLHFWYNPQELEPLYEWVQNQLRTNPAYFELVKKRFYEYLNPLLPYVSNQKKIQTVKEFKIFYRHWLRWWSPMDSIFFIPDFENVPLQFKHEALQIREQTQHVTDEVDRVFKTFLNEKYPHYSDLADLMLPDEVFILEKRNLTPIERLEIEKRKQGCAIFRGKVLLLSQLDQALAKHSLFLEVTNPKKTNALWGVSAYPGVAKGPARLVLYKSDLASVKAGEIIVTEMTSPEFVSAIQQAAAIVTDEGGITSHAAIICRELQKPCVMGTRIATQLIRTGDWIEVNAKHGTVRILKQG